MATSLNVYGYPVLHYIKATERRARPRPTAGGAGLDRRDSDLVSVGRCRAAGAGCLAGGDGAAATVARLLRDVQGPAARNGDPSAIAPCCAPQSPGDPAAGDEATRHHTRSGRIGSECGWRTGERKSVSQVGLVHSAMKPRVSVGLQRNKSKPAAVLRVGAGFGVSFAIAGAGLEPATPAL